MAHHPSDQDAADQDAAPVGPRAALPDPVLMTRTMAEVAARGQQIVAEFLRRQAANAAGLADEGPAGEPAARPAAGSAPGPAGGLFGMAPGRPAGRPLAVSLADPLNIGGAFMEMTARLMASPARIGRAQLGFWQDYLTLWQNTTRRLLGAPAEPVIEAEPGDRHFRDQMWRDNEVFDFIRQSYLLCARYFQTVAGGIALPSGTPGAQKVEFYTRQFVDAMSPSNFLFTSPEVLRRTVESGGENLLRGLSNLLADLERSRALLLPGARDGRHFRIGETVAATPGKVVFQNALMQLIQYAPTTESVLRRPLLILPPWINKYYVLDLRPRNSFVRWAVAQGHTVFVCSWVDPDASLAGRGFEDYMREGPYAALAAIERATGETSVNALGYSLGGTLLAAVLAQMAARGDRRIASATLLASMLDFSEAGELGVFIDEEQMRAIEEEGDREGQPAALATSRMLRANDLIWSFVVSNYLLGQEPFPFDLLRWNNDTTRMPSRLHGFYLEHLYRRNELAEPGALVLDGVPLDLGRVDVPAYVTAAREDHIAPWKSVYRATRLLGGGRRRPGSGAGGAVRFVLAASGHVAGVVNPPGAGRYSYWIGESLPEEPEAWFEGATELSGSWWPDWQRWVLARSREQVPAGSPGRQPGRGGLPALEDAPGSYVRAASADQEPG
ncbi:class I poly(R)-hydroxyalkanoic acid synthase [Roseomonas sp. NAR14]|uniref:Class I poly(R)-hydroxyalkanoic acid synthase n=1 Tax=Roseomonas acroporae TaxID=2937791 RepID=A0A9X2BUL8_9PROT|nr:class I poly(R)-hydroxyalkanoic acid synthase [Roseomonas acroporae]MCK8784241.1 class I poly(R)-hydroxyalkanoic acid synthase [Roseomonas acroporae]